jgi:hypothetical protein
VAASAICDKSPRVTMGRATVTHGSSAAGSEHWCSGIECAALTMAQHEYFAAHTADSIERERITALEAATDPKSKRHLQALGIGPGWNYLEVGGGGGSITRWLSENVGPTGRVAAADIDSGDSSRPELPWNRLDIRVPPNGATSACLS